MNNNLSKKIMARIYLIYLLRSAYSVTALKIYLLGILFIILNQLSSLPNIFINMWRVSSFNGIINFWLSAFSHTEISIQLIILASITILAFLIKDIYKNFSKAKLFISRTI